MTSTEKTMHMKNGRIIKNVREVSISDLSVFIWLNDDTRIEVYAKDISKLVYTKVDFN